MRLTPHRKVQKQERKVRLREFLTPVVAGTLLFLGFFLMTGSEAPYGDSESHAFPAFQTLDIKVKGRALWRLRTLREKALEEQVLINTPKSWVNGKLIEGKMEWPIRLRLKGDWTDHLQAGKWSFRVQLKDSTAYRRLKVFSLQSPSTRSFLEEWYFHQALLQEGILTTRYDFVRLHFNGAELGIYALEEHFSKEMIEGNGHRESAILKLNEDGMWEARRKALAEPDFPYTDFPLYEVSHPEAFHAKDLLKKKGLRDRHRQGQALLHAFKYGLRPADEVFDLDQAARTYALIDLFGAHHCLEWHNQRFYFEPISAKLHLVVYDAYSGDIGGGSEVTPFLGYGDQRKVYYDDRMDLLVTRLFAEDEFLNAYYQYLHAYTSAAFLDSLEQANFFGLQCRENFLRREYLFYRYPDAKLRATAARIREALYIDPGLLQVNGTTLENHHPIPLWVSIPANDNIPGSDWQDIKLLTAYGGGGTPDQITIPPAVRTIQCRIPGGESRIFDVVELQEGAIPPLPW